MQTKYIGIKRFRQELTSLYEQAVKNNWYYVVLSRNQPLFEVRPLTAKDPQTQHFMAEPPAAKKKQSSSGRVKGRVDILMVR